MINQCDGCRSKAPLKTSIFGSGLLHVDKLGRAFMCCVAYMYTDEQLQKEAEYEQEARKLEDAMAIQQEIESGLDDTY